MIAKKKLLGEFKIGRTIGEGAFSKVKLATHKVTGEKVAIKIVKKEESEKAEAANASVTGNLISSLSKEVKLLMRLDHPNVIKLYQVIDTEPELYIVMEYASGGELIDYIAGKGILQEKEARKYFRQLISAIDHCHLAGVVHRDLKLENLLLSTEKNLLLSDFGLGRSIRESDQILNTFCGTPLYAAPELVSGIKYIGPSADIWSLGIVLFIMCAGKPPFKCDTIAELYAQIKGVKYTCPPSFTQELRDLLTKILVRDPNKRGTIDDLRTDQWVNLGEDSPPARIPPRILVADRKEGANMDDEIDKLISGVSHNEEFTVYTFGHGDTPGSISHEPRSIDSNISKMSRDVSGTFVNNAESADRRASGEERRESLTQAIGRFNPFGGNKGGESNGAADSAQKQQRSKSITPIDIVTNNNVKPRPVNEAPVAPAPQTLAPPTHRRRHSEITTHSQIQPQIQPTPAPLKIPLSHAPAANKNANVSSTPGIVVASNSPSAPARRPVSMHEDGKPILAPLQLPVITQHINNGKRISHSNSGSRLQPSMEGINENGDEPSTPSSPTMTAPPPSVGRGLVNSYSSGRIKGLGRGPIRSASSGVTSIHQMSINHSRLQKTVETGADGSTIISPVDSDDAETTQNSQAAHPQRRRQSSIVEQFHLPNTAGYGDELRSVRFSFNVHSTPTSSEEEDPSILVKQIELTLQNKALFPAVRFGKDGIDSERRGKYVIVGHYVDPPTNQDIVFEIEVCKVWLLKMHGFRMKRLKGDALSYKMVYEQILTSLQAK